MKLRELAMAVRILKSSESCGVTVVATASESRVKSMKGYQSNVTMRNSCPWKLVGGTECGEGRELYSCP